MKNSAKIITILKWVSVALMAGIIALQFVPYWEVEGVAYSISKYFWFPTEQRELISHLRKVAGVDIDINVMVVPALCQLVGSVIGIFMYITKKRGPFAALIPTIAGVGGVWGCLAVPQYKVGSLWIVLLAVSAVTLIVGATMFVLGIIRLLTEEEE